MSLASFRLEQTTNSMQGQAYSKVLSSSAVPNSQPNAPPQAASKYLSQSAISSRIIGVISTMGMDLAVVGVQGEKEERH